jgi:hypothetical protein
MSNQLDVYDFLKKQDENDEPVRQEARNILSSYSQVYDVLAESLQNAVDAIDERYSQEPTQAVAKIQIVFDAARRNIIITDTGTGMPWEILRSAPCPNTTYKRRNQQSVQTGVKRSRPARGEKGVGLSFLTFVCNKLRVKTCDGSRTIEVTIDNANRWVNEQTQERPLLKPSSTQAEPVTEELGSRRYTQLEMGDVSTGYSEQDIFDLSLPALLYILRTRTAIGNTEPVVFDRIPEPDIEVTLHYIDKSGNRQEKTVPYKYLSPEEYLTAGSIILYNRFLELQKYKKLHLAKGKALVYRHELKTQGGRSINCYAFAMAPKAFDEITKDLELESGMKLDHWSGIFVATRGMPTGISVEHPTTYSAGYWQRIFMLLQDDEMNFDVGRKSLQGRAKPMIQGIAKEIWDEVLPYLQELTPADPESVARHKQGQLTKLFDEASKWPDLNLGQVQGRVQYLKEPQREQMVVALFYELVGAGILKGYHTLRNNTIDQYDAFVAYSIDKNDIGRMEAKSIKTKDGRVDDRIIIEFKFDAEDIVKDITGNIKNYRDINLLVCWKLQAAQFEKINISVEPIAPEHVYYYGSTHQLYFPGIYQAGQSLAVIELKTFLEQFQAQHP